MALAENVKNSRVLITGAGRGMGALYARMASEQGASHIVLWDVDEVAAQSVAESVSRTGLAVLVVSENLAQLDSIRVGAKLVREFMSTPDILINNAGIVRGAPFWEHDAERDIELTMRINTLAPMWLTNEFAQDMIDESPRPKRILNVASAAGTVANPNMSVYAASKWALLGWSESIRLEFEKHGYSHITVTTFCPSYVSTGMFEGARGPLLTPIMTPQIAADAAWEGMLAGVPVVTKPWTVKLAMALRGVLPARVWDVVGGKFFGIYSSMDEFKGHSK